LFFSVSAVLAACQGSRASSGGPAEDAAVLRESDTPEAGGSHDAPADEAFDAAPADGVARPDAASSEAAPDVDSGLCNNVANTAPSVAQMDVASARPAGTGGTILDGTYFKTGDAVYTGPGGASGSTGLGYRETLVVENASSGTALLSSVFVDSQTQAVTTERLTLTPRGAGSATLVFVCPAYGPQDVEYSVRVAGGVVELDISIGTDRIETFTRQ
jgi:hypothetical protein